MTHQSQNTITVVIPTFNRRHQLQKAVESVLQELRIPICLCIFDNASTDETQAYAASLVAIDSRVSYFRNAENVGATGNYSHALESVATRYFVPLADDDWLLPNFLFDAYQILERYPEAGAAVFVTEARNEQGELRGTYPSEVGKIKFGLLQPSEHLRDLMRYGHYAWSSILWRVETLECLGAPYLHVGLPSDVDFQLQIFCKYAAYLVNRHGAVYFLHENQAARGFDLSHLRSWALLFKRLDRAVIGPGLLVVEEYLALRDIMQERYRGLWSVPSKAKLTGRNLIAAATSAGFRLGDWNLAFSLIGEYCSDNQGVPLSAKASDQIFVLPEVNSIKGVARQDWTCRTGNILATILCWLKVNRQAVDGMVLEIERLRQDIGALLAERDSLRRQAVESTERFAKLDSEVEHLKVTRFEAKRECHSMKTSLSWRLTWPLRILREKAAALRRRIATCRSHR